MKIVGIGFRGGAAMSSLQDALTRALEASGEATFDAIVTESAKSRAPVFRELAQVLSVPGLGVRAEDMAGMITPSQSQRILDRFGTGSLCEAAALAAAGPEAVLIVARVVSGDGMATAAVADVQREKA